MWLHTVLAVLYTGLCPSLVRESSLPKDWRSQTISEDSYPSITDANSRRLQAEGAISLYVDFGDVGHHFRLIIVKNLGLKTIIVSASIQKYVQGIFVQ